jgi:hypothetical protein
MAVVYPLNQLPEEKLCIDNLFHTLWFKPGCGDDDANAAELCGVTV